MDDKKIDKTEEYIDAAISIGVRLLLFIGVIWLLIKAILAVFNLF